MSMPDAVPARYAYRQSWMQLAVWPVPRVGVPKNTSPSDPKIVPVSNVARIAGLRGSLIEIT
jgi:hypothetical protein